MEKFANTPSNTLNGAINNSVTSVVVHSAASFPATGNFRILIDSEIMLVTSVSSNTFTVTRGAESTTAASHIDGAVVSGIVTAGALDAFRADMLTSGAYASKPTAGVAGRQYQTTDSYYRLYDNGSSWEHYGPIYPLSPADDSNFSWVNQGSATITTTSGGLVLYAPSNGGSDNLRGRFATLPSPPYTVTIGFYPICAIQGGICFPAFVLRESATGKMTSILVGNATVSDGSTSIRTFNHSGTTNFGLRQNWDFIAISPIWLRLVNDNTNILYQVGATPYDFIQMDSQAKASPFTTAADQYGFMLDPNNAEGKMVVFHLKVT